MAIKDKGKCSFPGCERSAWARLLCTKHYQRWRKSQNLDAAIGTPHDMSVIERIMIKLDKSGECWIWQGSTGEKGYGYIEVEYEKMLVHRLVYENFNGKIEDPKIEVMHTCDNPPCCNPDHLVAGTHLENMRDCLNKNRFFTEKRLIAQPKGETQGSSILRDKDIIEMRAYYAKNSIDRKSYLETINYLSKKYKTHYNNVKLIVLGKSWKHLLGAQKDDAP
jgi:HNH endonuclease